jgi:hypothetical protein
MNRLLLLSVLLFPSIAAAAEPGRVALYLQTESWAHAEPVPVDAYASDWKARLDRGSDGFAFLQAEVGLRYEAWRIGWVLQRQYVIDATRGAARLYHLTSNDRPAPANQRYAVDLQANFYSARGLRIGRSFDGLRLGSWQLAVEPSLVIWDGSSFEEGRLRGSATSDAEGELAYVASLDHFYSEDPLLDRKVPRPEGRGASLDLAGRFALGATWSGRYTVRNLLGRLWWEDAPYTLGELDSNTRQTDANGAVRFDPTLRGFEGNQSHRQRLPLFAQFAVERHLGAYGIGPSLVYTDLRAYPGLRLSRRGAQLHAALEYTPQARDALGAELRWNALFFKLASNARDWRDAETLSLQLGFELALDPLWRRR